ncbi:MAG: preprotein translocase subunit SecA [Pirellulaceae bacterium]
MSAAATTTDIVSLFPGVHTPQQRTAALDQYVAAVREIEQQLATRSAANLRSDFLQLRLEGQNDTSFRQENFLCAAAYGSEVMRRTLGFRLHDVQIRGALAAASGSIIEMQTGEGKTVVCGLAALIRSVFDQSVHVATTNNYLAERDHDSVCGVFRALGTSSAVIQLGASGSDTRAAYRCQITYGPGYLFGFDYLKDQIKLRDEESLTLGREVLLSIHGRDLGQELAQHLHRSIIVDEADSVLIDESTTPLILSGGVDPTISPQVVEGYRQACRVAEQMQENTHFTLDSIERKVELNDEGQQLAHDELAVLGRLDLRQPWPVYIQNALFAKYLLLRDEHYVVHEDKIKLVDQNTGRIFEDRTLRGGLHQAVQAREEVEIEPPNRTLARITRQRFFQLYDMVCGMTGTAAGSQQELEYFYHSPVVSLDPNRPCKRIELRERYFVDWEAKLRAIAADVRMRAPAQQPVLIGTRTIKESWMVANALKARGVEAVILNGVQDAEEADIVGRAGQLGAITIATNMAGRGTDIKLSQESRSRGGLHVICTQRHTSRRVDRQLAGRSARQGDPGSVQFFISADDDLFARNGKSLAARICRTAGDDGESRTDFAAEIERLQGKIEREQFELRRRLVGHDGWMDQIRETMAGD